MEESNFGEEGSIYLAHSLRTESILAGKIEMVQEKCSCCDSRPHGHSASPVREARAALSFICSFYSVWDTSPWTVSPTFGVDLLCLAKECGKPAQRFTKLTGDSEDWSLTSWLERDVGPHTAVMYSLKANG